MLQNHVAPSSGAHIVGHHGPRNTGGGSDDDCRPEGENILGNKKTGKAQNDFTGDRDIHISSTMQMKRARYPHSERNEIINSMQQVLYRSKMNESCGGNFSCLLYYM